MSVPVTCDMFQDAILTTDLPDQGLLAGDVGTVVARHVLAGPEDGNRVEFFDMTGRSVAVITLPESRLRQPTPVDRPSVRVLATR